MTVGRISGVQFHSNKSGPARASTEEGDLWTEIQSIFGEAHWCAVFARLRAELLPLHYALVGHVDPTGCSRWAKFAILSFFCINEQLLEHPQT